MSKNIKISIITVSFNSTTTIEDTLLSVKLQTYPHIEHVIIDGASTDSTMRIVQNYERAELVHLSEEDQGLYDAMNKGAKLATGDVIMFLNSDDYLASPHVIEKVAKKFQNKNLDCLFGEMVVINEQKNKVFRHYKPSNFLKTTLWFGTMPPHPGTFIKRKLFIELEGFNLNFKVTADYEFVVRLLKQKDLCIDRLSEVITAMRIGGVTSGGFESNKKVNADIYLSFKVNKIWNHPIIIWSKYFVKWTQLIHRKTIPPRPIHW